MDNEDIELKPLEGIGGEPVSIFTQANFPPSDEVLEASVAAATALAEADKFAEDKLTVESAASEYFVDALSIMIDNLQSVFAQLEAGKQGVQAVIESVKDKTLKAGVEFEFDRLDDPFDDALRDVRTQLDRLERQRNRARLARGL